MINRNSMISNNLALLIFYLLIWIECNNESKYISNGRLYRKGYIIEGISGVGK